MMLLEQKFEQTVPLRCSITSLKIVEIALHHFEFPGHLI